MEARTSDFVWEVFEEMKIEVLGVGHCVGKAAVSSERGAKNGYKNTRAGSARRRFAEAK